MYDDASMRTTVDIDDDVLYAAKELAGLKRSTAGRVLSDLARKALQPASSPKVRNGVPLLPLRPALAARPTLQLVNSLRDDT